MIDRIVDGFLTLAFSATTAFCFGVLGEAIDHGNVLGVLLACLLITAAGGGVLFFGRGLVCGFSSAEPSALGDAAESDRTSFRSDSADLDRRAS